MKNDAPPIAFFNSRRLRDYPRLMLGTMVLILSLNILLRQGWMGAVRQIIGGDFIMLYSAGKLFQQDINSLYNFQLQGNIQRQLLAPTPFEGIMPFNYPPYVAQAVSILAKLPLAPAFMFWSILTIVCVILAVYWISKYLIPAWLQNRGLTFVQLLVISFSFFAFIEGFQVGQNHALTLLLLTGMIVCTVKERWFLAGLIAGLTIYKPQFALGFLIIWIVWGKYKALAGYIITSVVWIGWFILNYGLTLIQTYFSILPLLLKMPYLEGFGGYLEVTPYGLLISLFPSDAWSGIFIVTQTLTILFSIGLAWIAFKFRKGSWKQKQAVIILAILYPLLTAPHTLLHDLIILIPAMVLWADQAPSPWLLYACIAIYLGAFILPLISHATGIAFLALIPLALLFAQIRQIIFKQEISN